MTANELIELMNRRPFSPLEIHLSDGPSILVEYPYNIATRRNGPVAIVYDSQGKTHFVSYRNITQIITSESEQSDSRN